MNLEEFNQSFEKIKNSSEYKVINFEEKLLNYQDFKIVGKIEKGKKWNQIYFITATFDKKSMLFLTKNQYKDVYCESVTVDTYKQWIGKVNKDLQNIDLTKFWFNKNEEISFNQQIEEEISKEIIHPNYIQKSLQIRNPYEKKKLTELMEFIRKEQENDTFLQRDKILEKKIELKNYLNNHLEEYLDENTNQYVFNSLRKNNPVILWKEYIENFCPDFWLVSDSETNILKDRWFVDLDDELINYKLTILFNTEITVEKTYGYVVNDNLVLILKTNHSVKKSYIMFVFVNDKNRIWNKNYFSFELWKYIAETYGTKNYLNYLFYYLNSVNVNHISSERISKDVINIFEKNKFKITESNWLWKNQMNCIIENKYFYLDIKNGWNLCYFKGKEKIKIDLKNLYDVIHLSNIFDRKNFENYEKISEKKEEKSFFHILHLIDYEYIKPYNHLWNNSWAKQEHIKSHVYYNSAKNLRESLNNIAQCSFITKKWFCITLFPLYDVFEFDIHINNIDWDLLFKGHIFIKDIKELEKIIDNFV